MAAWGAWRSRPPKARACPSALTCSTASTPLSWGASSAMAKAEESADGWAGRPRKGQKRMSSRYHTASAATVRRAASRPPSR